MTGIIKASATVADKPVRADIEIYSLGDLRKPVKTGKSPLTAVLKAGQYYVWAKYSGYEPMMSYVDLHDGQVQPIGFKLFPARPKPPAPPILKGKLAVKAFYNGRQISARVEVTPSMYKLSFYTPKTIELMVGTYLLRASISAWMRDMPITVLVENNVTKPVNFNFKRAGSKEA